MIHEHKNGYLSGKHPITNLIEMKLLKIVATICPATTRHIQRNTNESMVSTLERLKAMRQKGIITGTKERGHWVWNIPKE